MLVLHRAVYANPAKLDEAPVLPRAAKLAVALSLTLWAGLVLSGRLIAFDAGA